MGVQPWCQGELPSPARVPTSLLPPGPPGGSMLSAQPVRCGRKPRHGGAGHLPRSTHLETPLVLFATPGPCRSWMHACPLRAVWRPGVGWCCGGWGGALAWPALQAQDACWSPPVLQVLGLRPRAEFWEGVQVQPPLLGKLVHSLRTRGVEGEERAEVSLPVTFPQFLLCGWPLGAAGFWLTVCVRPALGGRQVGTWPSLACRALLLAATLWALLPPVGKLPSRSCC